MFHKSTRSPGGLLALLWTGLALGPGPVLAQTPSTAGAFTQNLFNPDLSLITDFSFAGANLKDPTAEALTVPGFVDETAREGKRQGINFNYFELAFSASVDPYFDFFSVVTFAPDEIGVEEAFIDSRQLPFGFKLRLGKFLSSFGRLNGLHKHAWDFVDTPLIYEGLIGPEGLSNPGLRLSWTAPVDFLLQLNAEVYQGVFDESPTFSSPPVVPGLYVGSAKTSFDVGDHVFLLGASAMVSTSGTVLYDAELTYKLLLSSYRSLAWQSEYLGRVHSTDLRQGGLYSQLVWRFDEPGQWTTGARLDLLQPLATMLQRYTALLEYSPTEFARFRLQYSFDRSRYFEGAQKDVHEVMLQVNIAVGPHGAHSF